jgi:hypothetical protein
MSSLLGRTVVRLSGLLIFPAVLAAASPGAPFTGSWETNAAKSQGAASKITSLTIQEAGDHIKVESVTSKGDAAVKTEFSCTTNGKECEFDDAGHKSKISMWYNGPALVAMKTDGPESDSASQWKLEVSSDGKTLTLTLSHILPAGNDETLVFDKK